MDPDNWSYGRACRFVLVRIAIRGAILFAALVAGLYAAWENVGMPFMAPILFAVGSVIGAVAGYLYSRKLVEEGGLEGRTILLPALALLLAAEIGACLVAAELRHGSVAVAGFAAAGLVLWSVSVCMFKLLTAK